MAVCRRTRRDGLRAGVVGVVVLACLWMCASATAAGDATSSACVAAEASPGFRGFMPDCRAYELVTPAFGGGQPAFGLSMAADGEHLLGLSFSGFAGAENLEQSSFEFGGIYEFSRSGSGWEAEALDPPASVYPRRAFVVGSADLSKSLWQVYVPTVAGEEVETPEATYNGWTLVVREAAGGGKGRFVTVGPVVAPGHEKVSPGVRPYEVLGASADLSHIFVGVTAVSSQLWPGDETIANGQSIYEYRGVGAGEPVLVGVRNEGALSGSPHVNEGAELVSRCGTRFNTASANGETVIFTAVACGGEPTTNELYARVGGSRTVALSEPSGEDCAACDTSVPSEPTFEGASEDGSRVFFASEQALLPGASGQTLYEYDFDTPAGERVTRVAADISGVATVVDEGTRVYFTSESVLTAGANGNGEVATEGGANLYVYDTQTGTTAFVTQEASGAQATRDGRYLLFQTARNLVGTEDTSTVTQLFEYDAATGRIARVSSGQTSPAGYECAATKAIEEGYDCNGNTTDSEYVPQMAENFGIGNGAFGGNVSPTGPWSHLSLSEEGVVVFTSPLALTPQAVPSRVFASVEGTVVGRTENVYEYRDGQVYLIAPGDEASPIKGSRLLGIDRSGKDVIFTTTDQLVPQDTDTQSSWYDSREEGGFPGPPSAPECAGTCQGPVPAAPSLPSALSAVTSGAGAVPTVVSKPVLVQPLSRAQKLARALAACRRGKRAKRRACEVSARRRYGAKKKKFEKKSGRSTK